MAITNDGRPVEGGPARPVYITNAASDPGQVSGGGGGASTISGPLGRAADAASVSTALSTEDVVLLTALLTTAAFQARVPVLAVDSTDKLRTSVYGKGTLAGDTPLLVDTNGRVTIVTRATMTVDSNSGPAGFASEASASARPLAVVPMVWNGGSADSQRGVLALTLLASAARAVTTNSSDQINYNWRGAILVVNVSAIGTGSITPSIQAKDSISGNYKTIWTAATPLTTNDTFVYALYPNAVAAGFTEAAAIMLTRTWRLAMVANNANSATYSASADMQL